MRLHLITLSLLLAACSGGTAPAADSLDPPWADDGKDDAFSYRWKILGDFDFGDAGDFAYHATSATRFVAVRFSGHEGDRVDAWVRSADGDPIAWILDSKYRVLGKNDDAAPGQTDAHIQVTIPAGGTSTVHYLVTRENDLADATFQIDLEGTHAMTWCDDATDCVKIDKSCCPDGTYAAVNKGAADAYDESLGCPTPRTCPAAPPVDAQTVSCSASGRCLLVSN